MTPERWQRLKKVTLAALELKEEELSAFLDNECGDDRELRDSVERLLAEDRQPGGSAERAIAAAAAQVQKGPSAAISEAGYPLDSGDPKILWLGSKRLVPLGEDRAVRRRLHCHGLLHQPVEELAATA